MGTNVPKQITVPKLNKDGTYGEVTWNVFRIDDVIGINPMASAVRADNTVSAIEPSVRMSEISPFKCPCCGGNSYRRQGSVIACEYCDTMFTV